MEELKDRLVGSETRKSHIDRIESGFYEKYMSGKGLEIGYRGYTEDKNFVVPILPTAIGIDMGYPGYDGYTLPFPDESQDYIFSSHLYEHIDLWQHVLLDWFRVIKMGGHIVIVVPHKFLYERKQSLPSTWAAETHKRFYTPSSLLKEIEEVYIPNTYRIVHLRDNDNNYLYSQPLDKHPQGCYEIECVIKKIQKPDWDII